MFKDFIRTLQEKAPQSCADDWNANMRKQDRHFSKIEEASSRGDWELVEKLSKVTYEDLFPEG